jgi:hypothetical protein
MHETRGEIADGSKRGANDTIKAAVQRRKVEKAEQAAVERQRIGWKKARLGRGDKLNAFFVYSFQLDFDTTKLLVNKSVVGAIDAVMDMLQQENLPTMSSQQLHAIFHGMAPARVLAQVRKETASNYWIITPGPTPSSLTLTSPNFSYETGEEVSNAAITIISIVL